MIGITTIPIYLYQFKLPELRKDIGIVTALDDTLCFRRIRKLQELVDIPKNQILRETPKYIGVIRNEW
jgi:hypothetical protein